MTRRPVVYIAPWILNVEIFDDSDPEQRELGLQGCEAVILRCDAVALVGGVQSAGMAREAAFARENGIEIISFLRHGVEPPKGSDWSLNADTLARGSA